MVFFNDHIPCDDPDHRAAGLVLDCSKSSPK